MNALESAFAAIDTAVGPTTDPAKLLIRAKCRGLMRGYHARWKNAGYVTTAVEQVVEADLWNPETQRKSKSLSIAGKIDVLATHSGRSVLFDHKTTSQDISDPNSPYWRQLVVESQPTFYMLLEWLNGRKVEQAVWDVVRKPQISPKALSKGDRQRILNLKEYCGYKVSQEVIEAVQAEERETLAMYEMRLVHDCTHERPQHYFSRRPVPRLDSEILEFAKELWDHGQELLAVRKSGRNMRNSGACMLYGALCKFLGICSGHDAPDSDRWQPKQQTHNELEGHGDNNTLTNSRIRCFQTCRRKHYFEYELGIERQDEEEREALYFGSLWHEGLNAWWLTFNEEEHEHAIDSPASEVGTASG